MGRRYGNRVKLIMTLTCRPYRETFTGDSLPRRTVPRDSFHHGKASEETLPGEDFTILPTCTEDLNLGSKFRAAIVRCICNAVQ